MNSDEFTDLQTFGQGIKKPSEEITVKGEKKNKNFTKKTIKKVSTRTLKLFFLFLKWLYKKTCMFLVNFFKLIKQKTSTLKIFKSRKIGYKIVETKKQGWNKITIVRKRVPITFNTAELKSKKINPSGIYYLNLKSNDTGNNEVNSENHFVLKESIWDFKIKDKKR